MRFFFGIGAQKAGTTWLYHNLRAQPEAWLPPAKEIHFFDQFGMGWRRRLRHLFGTPYLRNRFLAWRGQPAYWKYILRPLSVSWYLWLFSEARGRVTGDITPSYCTAVPRSGLRVMHELFPQAKIIMLLREPVARAWSQARMLSDRGTLDLRDEDVVKTFLASQAARSDYADILQRWCSFFPRDQVFVGYFEEIRDRPAELLTSICEFLALGEPCLDHLGDNPNPGPSIEIPAEWARWLARLHLPGLERAESLGGPVPEWLASARELAGSGDLGPPAFSGSP